MNSCEGLVEAKNRIGTRVTQITKGLKSNYDHTTLPESLYFYLFEPESELSFVHVVDIKRDRSNEAIFTAQSFPYIVRSEFTIYDAVASIKGIFKHREVALVSDSISTADFMKSCTGQRGRYRVDTPYGVDLFIENEVISQSVDITSQTHSPEPADMLK